MLPETIEPLAKAHREMGRRLLLTAAAGLAVLAAGTLGAEGAVKQLDCRVVRVCDAAGSCEPGSGEFQFRMEPIEVVVAGAGRYTLSYGETRAEMQAMGDAGPFFWTVGTERNALLVSSETEWLWHQLTLVAAPAATIRFMSCSFRQ